MAALTAFRSLCHHTCLKAGAAFGMALFMMTLSPPTAAQVSPGGGGVIPPADDPHFGWIPQPKPYDSQYPYLSTFDWIGLDVSVRRRYFDPPYGPGGSSDLDYKGWGGAGYISRPLEYNQGGVGGSYNGDGPGLSHSSLSVSGFSSFQWRWTPPNLPGTPPGVTDPDYLHFPVPPLYVLGRVAGSLQFRPQSQSLLGLVGSANISDGWGYSESLSGVPDYAPKNAADSEHRKVLGPATAAGANFEVRLSPSLSTDLFGVSFGGKAYTLAGVSESVSPIHLSAPDILGRPDLGDGKNQFAFNGYAIGQLLLPAIISLDGAGLNDTTWLVNGNHVNIKIATTQGTAVADPLPYVWQPSDNQILAQTQGIAPDGSAYPLGNFVFQGLSDSNGDFGTHLETLYVDTNPSEKAYIQAFYRSTASNWPNSDGFTPNWYHYYNQIYTSPGNYDLGAGSSYTNSSPPYEIHIRNDAYGLWDTRLYLLDSTTGLINKAGILQINGIHDYIFTCAHEATHQQQLIAGILMLGRPQFVNPYATTPAQDPEGDWDSDGFSNSWEIAHHLNPTNSDTAGYYSYNPTIGDSELCANIGGWGVLSTQKSTWRQDWADTGLQWGAWFPHNREANSAATSPYHPWNFLPETPYNPDSPPGDPGGVIPLPDPPTGILTTMP